jgi:hypothetical protein
VKKYVFVFLLALAASNWAAGAKSKILLIKDEMPQMQLLADYLEKKGGYTVQLIDQDKLVDSLTPYQAVVLYIHHQMSEKTELAVMQYVRQGGRLVVLHHSISSGKRLNRYWFDFLKIQLPDAPFDQDGYVYRDPVTAQLVNLKKGHYITGHDINWPEKVSYGSTQKQEIPAVTLTHTEVYLNHQYTDQQDKIILCGFKYFDEASGRWFMQDRAAWLKKADKGWIFYFMFGHKNNDFENPLVTQIILNAITYQP